MIDVERMRWNFWLARVDAAITLVPPPSASLTGGSKGRELLSQSQLVVVHTVASWAQLAEIGQCEEKQRPSTLVLVREQISE